MSTWIVLAVSAAYLGLLAAVARFGDRRADAGRSIISNGWVYALSLGVYATAWTFYGSVGRAAESGVGFLPIYLGPTLMAVLWVVVVRKIIRVCRQQRITSLADFVSARYGKSAALGQVVTVVAVLGVVPYIALQLKAVSVTFTLLRSGADGGSVADAAAAIGETPWFSDTALWVALLLAAFTIVFGTRHLDATERHEGMVAAIAVESVVKLLAFLVVGVVITYLLFDGFTDLFAQAQASPELSHLLSLGESQSYASWTWLIVLSALAFLLLPRQWQVGVVENVDESHLRTASWVLPAYLLAINVFVLPVTIAGLLTFTGGQVPPDDFVLALPMDAGYHGIALLVFLGGLSAATGMVVVETIALSTMVSNSLVLPALLRRRSALRDGRDLGRLVLAIRRTTIVAVLLLGVAYVRLAGESLSLVSIGLISFAAVAQFAPAVIGGLYWKGATARGALWGMVAGVVVWAYTLALPTLSATGALPASFVTDGPAGIGWLAPHGLFGVPAPDPVSHAMMWSMLVNIGLFVGLSLTGRRDPVEHLQATAFVDVSDRDPTITWRGSVTAGELEGLLTRFLGADAARVILQRHAAGTGRTMDPDQEAGADLVHDVERWLAGAVGSVSARVIVGMVTKEEPLTVTEVMQMLEETSQVLAYSRELEHKSAQLQQATAELQEANRRLQELDRLKDDFISSVTHELRTPLTSIRAFSEILLDNPELSTEERNEFLRIVVAETERLTRLINQVLDLSKLEAEAGEWNLEDLDLTAVVHAAVESTQQLAQEQGIELTVTAEAGGTVHADADRVTQVLVNLLGNAVKFATHQVQVSVRRHGQEMQVDVTDDGPGIPEDDHEAIFDKFHQTSTAGSLTTGGTGLGLPISRRIVAGLSGRLWVDSTPGTGATFSFTVPLHETTEAGDVVDTVS